MEERIHEVRLDSSPIFNLHLLKKQKVKVIGSHGYAILTLMAGYWTISEYPHPMERWQRILKFFRLYKQKYMIRATRVK